MLMVVAVACRKDHGSIQLDTTEIAFVSRTSSFNNWEFQTIQADGNNRKVIPGFYSPSGTFVISHDRKKIAWAVYEGSVYNLYVLNRTGGTPTLLSSGYYCGYPDWSPDDSKIIFIKGGSNTERAIYVVDSDGQHEKRLTSNQWSANAKWFPDGNTIAYITNADNKIGVHTMKADGSDRKFIALVYGELYISPTGNKIAITVSGFEQPTRIDVMNADGTNLKEVTAGVDHFAEDGMLFGETHFSPAWSPDGKKIAYVSSNGVRSDIYVMNSDGTGDKRLVNINDYNNSPSWSKDGKYILFASGKKEAVTKDIYIMKANGQSQTSITKNVGYNDYPVFVTP